MAIQTSNAEKLNAAIVKKVANVLNNAQHIDKVKIVIEGSREEYPTIRYDITEDIEPDDLLTNGDYVIKEGES